MKRKITMLALIGTMGLFGFGCDDNKATKKSTTELPPPAPVEQAPIAAPAPAPAPTPVAVEPAPLPAPAHGAAKGGAAAAKAGGSYVVQKGDTLYAISRKVYGSNARVKDIIAANPGIDPNAIKVGQKLVLP
jgi:nucleoid-associated protein YgaU